MSGRTTAATKLTLVSRESGKRIEQNYSGPMAKSGPRSAPGESPEWIKAIWASPHPDEATAFEAAVQAAATAPGGGQFTPLGSSFAGLAAQLFVVGAGTIPVAATRMIRVETPQNPVAPSDTPPLVKQLKAWTDMDLMTPEEKADWESAHKQS